MFQTTFAMRAWLAFVWMTALCVGSSGALAADRGESHELSLRIEAPRFEETSTQVVLSFELRNTGDRPITAWYLDFMYGSGDGLRTTNWAEMRDFALGGEFDGPLEPGATRTIEAHRSVQDRAVEGAFPVATASVRMVLFDDGSFEGDAEIAEGLLSERSGQYEMAQDTLVLLRSWTGKSDLPRRVASALGDLEGVFEEIRTSSGRGATPPETGYDLGWPRQELEDLRTRLGEYPEYEQELLFESIEIWQSYSDLLWERTGGLL